MITRLKQFWQIVRTLSGDDAYERYLEHFETHHAKDGQLPLSRVAFYQRWQDEKWKGIKRCC